MEDCGIISFVTKPMAEPLKTRRKKHDFVVFNVHIIPRKDGLDKPFSTNMNYMYLATCAVRPYSTRRPESRRPSLESRT